MGGSLDTLGGVVSTWPAFALTLGTDDLICEWLSTILFNSLYYNIFTYYHLQPMDFFLNWGLEVDVDILHFLAV